MAELGSQGRSPGRDDPGENDNENTIEQGVAGPADSARGSQAAMTSSFDDVDDEALFADDFFDEVEDDEATTVDEMGRRHVRRAAPEGTEQLVEREQARTTGLPDKVERWRQRSAAGAVLTAVAFGLQQAFETERKEPAIIMETSGEPPTELPVEAQLEQLGPRRSTVTVRPWLLGANAEVDTGSPQPATGTSGGATPLGAQGAPDQRPTGPAVSPPSQDPAGGGQGHAGAAGGASNQ